MVAKGFGTGVMLAALLLLLPAHFTTAGDSNAEVILLYQRWARAHGAQLDGSPQPVMSPKASGVAAPASTDDPDAGSRFLALGRKLSADSDPAAALALVFAVYTSREGPVCDQALELLARDHVSDPRLGALLRWSRPQRDIATGNFAHAVAEHSTNRLLRAEALLVLAERAKDNHPEEAEKIYREIINQYADLPGESPGSPPPGEEARAGLDFVQRLSIGRTAPEIIGGDLAGQPFKLSDYRGKVVLLCFSSETCAPCRALHPYEHSLVERMQTKPFAFFEIRPDPKSILLSAVKRDRINWRICMDQDSDGKPGRIAKDWQVAGVPNLYLLDHQGVIRQHWLGSPGTDVLDQKIAELVGQASPPAAH